MTLFAFAMALDPEIHATPQDLFADMADQLNGKAKVLHVHGLEVEEATFAKVANGRGGADQILSVRVAAGRFPVTAGEIERVIFDTREKMLDAKFGRSAPA